MLLSPISYTCRNPIITSTGDTFKSIPTMQNQQWWQHSGDIQLELILRTMMKWKEDTEACGAMTTARLSRMDSCGCMGLLNVRDSETQTILFVFWHSLLTLFSLGHKTKHRHTNILVCTIWTQEVEKCAPITAAETRMFTCSVSCLSLFTDWNQRLLIRLH